MIASAAASLASHGRRGTSGDVCVCGHDSTPLPRHVAQVVADTISPSLTREVMALLSEVMSPAAPRQEHAVVKARTGPDAAPVVG